MFENPERNIAVEEGHEFAEESARNRYSVCVGALSVSMLEMDTMAARGWGVPNVQVPSERIV